MSQRQSKTAKDQTKPSATQRFEDAISTSVKTQYYLRLYVSGNTPRSQDALRNIERICTEHLKDRVKLEVIDVYQSPDAVRSNQLVALPTLVKVLPLPLRKIIGDLSNEANVLVGLELSPRPLPESDSDDNEPMG